MLVLSTLRKPLWLSMLFVVATQAQPECGPTEGVFALTYAKDYEFSRADWLLLNISSATTAHEQQPPLIARCFDFSERTCTVPLSADPSVARYRTSTYTTCLPLDGCYRLVTFGNYYSFPEESEDFLEATFAGEVVVPNHSNHAFDTFAFGSGDCGSSSSMDCVADTESLLELFFLYEAPADTLDDSGIRYVDDFAPLPNITFTIRDATQNRTLLERVVTGGNASLALQYMRQCVPTESCFVVQAQAPAFQDVNTFYNPPYQVKLDGVVFGDQKFDPFTECNRASLTETILVGATAATCTAALVCDDAEESLMHLTVAPDISRAVPNTLFRWDYAPQLYFDPDPLLYCWNGENRLYPGLSSSSQTFVAFECVPADVCLRFALRAEDDVVLGSLRHTLSLDGTVLPSRPHELASEGGTFDDVIYFENCSSAVAMPSLAMRLWGVGLGAAMVVAIF